MLILKNDVPPFLCVSFLETCFIDLQYDMITWRWLGKPHFVNALHRLKRRHRSVNACDFHGVDFYVPDSVLETYGVTAASFVYQAVPQAVRNRNTSVPDDYND